MLLLGGDGARVEAEYYIGAALAASGYAACVGIAGFAARLNGAEVGAALYECRVDVKFISVGFFVLGGHFAFSRYAARGENLSFALSASVCLDAGVIYAVDDFAEAEKVAVARVAFDILMVDLFHVPAYDAARDAVDPASAAVAVDFDDASPLDDAVFYRSAVYARNRARGVVCCEAAYIRLGLNVHIYVFKDEVLDDAGLTDNGEQAVAVDAVGGAYAPVAVVDVVSLTVDVIRGNSQPFYRMAVAVECAFEISVLEPLCLFYRCVCEVDVGYELEMTF